MVLPKAIISDLDGVIIDSEPAFYQAVRLMCSDYGVDLSIAEYINRFMLHPTASLGLKADYGIQASLKEMKRRRDEYFIKMLSNGVHAIPGALDLLVDCHREWPIGVVSSAERDMLDLKLDRVHLSGWFDVSVSADDVQYKKPHPEPYLKACSLFGIAPGEAVVIEDNPSGVLSAITAGCKVVAFPNGFTRNLEFPPADLVVYDLRELNPQVLRSLYTVK